jgi:chromosome segregation ATPase
MPLSRQQEVDMNERRVKGIADELVEIATAQGTATTAQEQKDLLTRKSALDSEQRALQNANAVLQGQIADAEKEHKRFEAEHWEKEKIACESEFQELADKIETRLINTKKLYDDLIHAEERAKDQWRARGLPGEPARTLSRRSFAGFVGVSSTHALGTLTGRRRRFAQLFSTRPRAK